ncbi:hypothetical protein V1508DRAFT_407892 [Lipomyces doorenjongii]|uniref:uncharacterized protein n=1 Tax=Lipomyces doorenjongii TaxID=383834 RepID=UPI0034CF3C38
MSFFKWMSGSAASTASPASTPKPNVTVNTSGMANELSSNDASGTCTPSQVMDVLPPKIDGSDKFFGMENFGNTCYCNSIIQCLYYTKPFREMVVNYPTHSATVRPPRLSVRGKTPHPFADSTDSKNNANSRSQSGSSTPKSGFGISYFSLGSNNNSSPNTINKENGMNGTANSTNSGKGLSRSSSVWLPTDLMKQQRRSSSAAVREDLAQQPLPPPRSFQSSSNSSLSSQSTSTSINTQVPTSTSLLHMQLPPKPDEAQTPEQKKKAALQNGPVINLDHSLASSYGMEETLFATLKDLFEAVMENRSRTGVVSPAKLIEVLKRRNELFRSSMHQDAHEFFNFLLNEIIENVKDYDAKLCNGSQGSSIGPRWVHDLFEGLLTSETKCLTCENVSTRDEQFMDLSIDLEDHCSVTACLQQFSASELLCQNNKFHCDCCCGLQEAQRRIKIKRLPRILALHLKRFKFTEDMQRNMKLFYRVVFPFHLRLFNNTTDDVENPDQIYELYAVVVHVGGGPYHGHYVSIVKTEHAGWVLFDDEMAERVDEQYVQNFFGDKPGLASAYILFYQAITEEQYRISRMG